MKHIYAFLLLIPLLISCTSSPVEPEPTPHTNITYICETESIEIAWDAPPKSADSISSYELYARSITHKEWDLLEENITSTQTVINRSQLGTGIFELAVKSVSAEGEKSDYHKSIDADAIPVGGWRLEWR